MIIRDFKGEDISLFGMGCMRLPKLGDGSDDGAIDEAQAVEMIDLAYESGCNYFDTAWGYHNGNSETCVGKALAKYPRDTFNLASKFPGYDPSNWGKVEEIFEKQLEKCQVEHFDFYLFHNVCEMNIEAYLDDEKYGIASYLKKQVENGRIRHLGFSVHGMGDEMERFLEAYGDIVEFVQVQLNYIDYKFQNAKAKLELAAKYNLPVVVMEPLRGGMLAKATEEEAAQLSAQRPGTGIVEWAVRYLQDNEQVMTILLGSSSMEQIKENLSYFEDEESLSPEDLAVLNAIVTKRISDGIVACTACRYCTSHCPLEIDIPRLLELFNEHKFTGGGFMAPMALGMIDKDKQPGSCIACGACATVCPQTIDIPGALAEFAEMLG